MKYNDDGEEIIGEGSEIIQFSKPRKEEVPIHLNPRFRPTIREDFLPEPLRKSKLKERYDPPNRTDFSEEGTRLLEEWRELQRRKQQEQHDAIARRTLIESEHWKIEAEKNRIEKEKREYNEKYGAWL